MADAAVDEGEWFEAAKSVDHIHVAKVLEDQLDDIDFVNFFHVALLEAIHAFLRKPIRTIKSSRAVSDFLGITFSVFSYFPKSIQLYLNYLY